MPRVKLLYVHHRPELGGAPDESLSSPGRELDRDRFEPHVYCPPGAAAELFREAGATVHTGPVAGVHAHLGVDLPRPPLAALRARARAACRSTCSSSAARCARAPLRARPLQRLAADPGRVARAPRGAAGRLAPSLRAAGGRRATGARAFVRPAIARLATTSIAINHDVARRLRRRLDGRRRTPSTSQRFHPGDPSGREGGARPRRPDRPVVSYFGFIYPSKGFHEFIEAAARLRERGHRRELPHRRRRRPRRGVLPHRRRPLAAARRPDAQLRVARRSGSSTELGARRRRPLRPVHAGHGEPLPGRRRRRRAVARARSSGGPVIEAAASGVPVVASGSRTGGGVVVPGETGVLVDGLRVDALADGVAELLARSRSGGARSAARRARHAEENFDPARNARRIEEIYERSLPSPERIPILYVHHRPQLGGAPSSLAQLIREPRPALRAARLLPGGPGRGALRRGGRDRPHGRRLDLRARLGQPLRGPALARARPRGRRAAAATSASSTG